MGTTQHSVSTWLNPHINRSVTEEAGVVIIRWLLGRECGLRKGCVGGCVIEYSSMCVHVGNCRYICVVVFNWSTFTSWLRRLLCCLLRFRSVLFLH
jgi:hypothetical protein